MSISLPGTLTVQAIQGRRGIFHVAQLFTSIGEFNLKNPVLMQFAPGEYPGNFILEQIKVKAYEWKGGATSYIDATLDWAALELFAKEVGCVDEAGQGTFDPNPGENGIVIPDCAQTIEHIALMINHHCRTVNLGEYILSDREVLGSARDLLREAGYVFQPQAQAWLLQEKA